MSLVTPAPTPTVAVETETRLRMSYDEFLAWADEDTHAEWVNGEVIVFIPAKDFHQATLGFLHRLLGLYISLFDFGKIRVAPLEMRAQPDGPAREPDLLFVAREHLVRLTADRLAGPADLVIELISDDSVRRDRETKFKEYCEAGIPEYWVIDPRPGKQRAEFFWRDQSSTYQPITPQPDGRIASTVLPGFWLRPAWLWEADNLDPLLCALEIEGVAEALAARLKQAQGKPPTTDG